ncbi:translesion error-prone DNA polymerase V autoproteolytic subunit [Prochlorococcus marinus XMU1411]|uniref:LexA family protein n=1 Tax=Prochlorococcus marinus TaxID=1219 RepID=UPI001ADA256D|nr:translesion error-prone DNA polymerase V autoproteolytic subunit [Prochlorococcus marinus]MBO8243743.1 translesion error-prone DNA polymerase V autoproteolytic subunit [Prochlorococcus marinus XMU1411]MBW3054849.1 peptidase S24 [Prochlorococcus marinus str. MU1411]MCR8538438.1 translesion error-prone DNA polymerase V autoproteolytic subunit [Prochlorococcus marinus CUG1430]
MDFINSTTKKFRIPLLNDSISAGFPSPADDYTEENIDLNEHLISNPFSTFFLRVKGDSMINAGIKDKDLIIVDKSLIAKPGNIVIAMIDGEFTIKRLSIKNDELYLKAENHNYPDFRFKNHIDVQIWGVVIYSIHSYL